VTPEVLTKATCYYTTVIAIVLATPFQPFLHPRVLFRFAVNLEDAADLVVLQFFEVLEKCENRILWELGNGRVKEDENFAEIYLSNFQVLNFFETAAVTNAWSLRDFFSLAENSMKTELPFLNRVAIDFFAAPGASVFFFF